LAPSALEEDHSDHIYQTVSYSKWFCQLFYICGWYLSSSILFSPHLMPVKTLVLLTITAGGHPIRVRNNQIYFLRIFVWCKTNLKFLENCRKFYVCENGEPISEEQCVGNFDYIFGRCREIGVATCFPGLGVDIPCTELDDGKKIPDTSLSNIFDNL